MAKRRTFSTEFKARVDLEALSGRASSDEICWEYKIKSPLLYRWKARCLENSPKMGGSDERCSEDHALMRELDC